MKRSILTIGSIVYLAFVTADKSEFGTLSCINGGWIPDVKLLGFGLACPLPLDGKSSSKGKTTVCAFKKAKLYDGKTVKKDKIGETVCAIYKDEAIEKECKGQVQTCLKNSKGYFKNPKTDTDHKSWSEPYECMEEWTKTACKKE